MRFEVELNCFHDIQASFLLRLTGRRAARQSCTDSGVALRFAVVLEDDTEGHVLAVLPARFKEAVIGRVNFVVKDV
jgi:hypothetical protein